MVRVRRVSAARVRRFVIPAVLMAVALEAGGAISKPAAAATPGSGTVSAATPTFSWDFGPIGGPPPGSGATDSFNLTVQLPTTETSFYAPDVRQGTKNAAVLQITMTWADSAADQSLQLSVTDPGGNSVGNDTLGATNDGGNTNVFQLQSPVTSKDSGSGTTVTYTANTLTDTSKSWTVNQWAHAIVEPTGFPPATVASNTATTLSLASNWATTPTAGAAYALHYDTSETYTVTASNFNGNSTSAIPAHALASLQLIDLAHQAQPPNPVVNGTGFAHYHLPLSLMPLRAEESAVGGRFFGEPSIGVDPRNDNVMYQAGLYTIRATFDDSTKPATASYTDVSFPISDTASEDAIVFVDRKTGRTFASQLILACSLGAVSDNDGTNWTTATSPCQKPAGIDHQTIGAGPFASPLPPGVVYPDAAYYCSQNVAESECALSVDGGLNYGPASVMWTSAQCFGLHGHVKVAPNDGTVYVPDKACGAPECLIVTSTAGPNCHPGFAVSTNNGTTWTVHTINEGHFRYFTTGDPSIGIGANGTMYYGWNNRDGTARVAVCKNQGTSCGPSVDVGAPFHVVNTEMPTVVAGDDNRAAFAFLGSTTPGDDQQYAFVGTWHIYVAVTYDGGAHWTTSDVTPDHPVQRGCIEFNASCPSSRGTNDQRNLLDFNDLTIDREGRVLIAYTDGCQMDGEKDPAGKGACLTDATRLSGLPTEIEGPAIARQTCGRGLYAKYDNLAVACTPSAQIPEAARTSGLILGGVAALGVVAIARRRRRRPAPATSG